MKTTDIKVGTYYAVHDSTFGLNRAALGRDSSWVVRAKVVSLNGVLKGKRSWQEPTRGIVVEGKGGKQFVVKPRQILGTWAEHLRAREVLAKAAAEQRQAKDQLFNDTANAVRSIKRIVGARNEHLPWQLNGKFERYSDGSFSTKASLSISDLEALINAAYDAGKASK